MFFLYSAEQSEKSIRWEMIERKKSLLFFEEFYVGMEYLFVALIFFM